MRPALHCTVADHYEATDARKKRGGKAACCVVELGLGVERE